MKVVLTFTDTSIEENVLGDMEANLPMTSKDAIPLKAAIEDFLEEYLRDHIEDANESTIAIYESLANGDDLIIHHIYPFHEPKNDLIDVDLFEFFITTNGLGKNLTHATSIKCIVSATPYEVGNFFVDNIALALAQNY